MSAFGPKQTWTIDFIVPHNTRRARADGVLFRQYIREIVRIEL
jgi:hypothetical protein